MPGRHVAARGQGVRPLNRPLELHVKRALLLATSLLSFHLIGCATKPIATQIDSSLLLSIKSAHNQATSIGSKIWPNYDEAPFGLLVTLEGREVLFCHGSIADGFDALPPDLITKCDLQERTNAFPKNLLAAMPVIGGVSTIVMGTPQSTGKDEPSWTRTIFHEHFHQYQSTFDSYYNRLNGLNLSNGDNTGMWMLNYPFPYKDENFNTALSRASRELHDAITQHGASFQEHVSGYLKARQELEASVPANDWKYLELQLWAEGVARWTEIEIAIRSSDHKIAESGESLKQRTISSLLALDAVKFEREIAYPYGAAEAMLLDRCNPTWRQDYPAVVSLGVLVKAIDPSNCR